MRWWRRRCWRRLDEKEVKSVNSKLDSCGNEHEHGTIIIIINNNVDVVIWFWKSGLCHCYTIYMATAYTYAWFAFTIAGKSTVTDSILLFTYSEILPAFDEYNEKKFAHTFFGWYNDILHRLDQVREEMNMNMEKTKDALINIKICLCQCTMCYDDVRAWNEFGPMAQLNLLLKIILTVQTRIKICK